VIRRKHWYKYTSDNGLSYSILVPAYIALAATFSDLHPEGGNYNSHQVFLARDAEYPLLPRGCRPRYAIIHPYPRIVGSPYRHRKLIVGNPAAFANLYQTFSSVGYRGATAGAIDFWCPTRVVGESFAVTARYDDYR